MILKGKTAIVTGASDGIGKQVALKLADQGVGLALIARTKENLEKTKAEILAGHPKLKVNIYPCDLTKTTDLKKTITQIISDYKNVHILLNFAAIWQKVGPLEEIPEEVVDKVITTNLAALIHCTRFVLPILKKQDEAAIINISSRSGIKASEGQTVYSASKWGVRGFTEVLKVDLKDTGVRVAGVYQAGTKTNMFAKAGDLRDITNFTDPADLADVIVYMLSRPSKIWLPEVHVEY